VCVCRATSASARQCCAKSTACCCCSAGRQQPLLDAQKDRHAALVLARWTHVCPLSLSAEHTHRVAHTQSDMHGRHGTAPSGWNPPCRKELHAHTEPASAAAATTRAGVCACTCPSGPHTHTWRLPSEARQHSAGAGWRMEQQHASRAARAATAPAMAAAHAQLAPLCVEWGSGCGQHSGMRDAFNGCRAVLRCPAREARQACNPQFKSKSMLMVQTACTAAMAGTSNAKTRAQRSADLGHHPQSTEGCARVWGRCGCSNASTPGARWNTAPDAHACLP
jgi:hypothetical protein